MHDKIAKGRGNHINGERVHGAKLDAGKVQQIRAKYRHRIYGSPRLAKEFGVTEKVILRVVKGTAWKHVPETEKLILLDVEQSKKKISCASN